MDNKISNMDISRFDPTEASVRSVRQWLFAIIDSELDKDPEERDYDLIEDCSELERELPTEESGMSESEITVGLERIKAHVATEEIKENKIIISKKKSRKSVRVIVILAAVISTMLLSLTAIAFSQGKSVGEFISENIQKIFCMDAGEQMRNEEITLIKNGNGGSYSSLEQAVCAAGVDILYPSYLPKGIKIERVVMSSADDGKTIISYITNDEKLYIRVTTGVNLISDSQDVLTVHRTLMSEFYIFNKNGEFQAIGLYNGNRYAINYNDYDVLLKILNSLKEIEK